MIWQQVVVAGAGFIGCETGLYLVQQGKKVTVFDVLSLQEIASDGFSKIGLMQLMDEHGVQLKTEVKLGSIDKDCVTVIDKQGRENQIPADSVVISLGCTSLRRTVGELEDLAPVVYSIGDCVRPRNLRHAVHDAFNIAVEL